MKHLILFLLLSFIFIGCVPAQKPDLAADKQTYWYPFGQGSIGGISFVIYTKDDTDYSDFLIFTDLNIEQFKDSLIGNFKRDIRFDYIIGNYAKVKFLKTNDSDPLIFYIDKLAQSKGLSKGYLTPDESRDNYYKQQKLSLDKIHGK